MTQRRKLSQRIQSPDNVHPEAMRAFVTQELRPVSKDSPGNHGLANSQSASVVHPIGLIPVTVRLRPEIAGGLKRASLERQLARAEYFSQQEIVERCLRIWLEQNGYLPESNAASS